MNELIPQLEEVPAWVSTLATVAASAFILLAFVAFVTIVVYVGDGSVSWQKGASKSQKKARNRTIAVTSAAIITFVIGISCSGFNSSVNKGNEERLAQAAQAREKWVESHGVNVKKDTLDELDFPNAQPTGDEEYGIAQVTRNKAVITVTLAWEDGKFVLYGTDGEPMEVLDR